MTVRRALSPSRTAASRRTWCSGSPRRSSGCRCAGSTGQRPGGPGCASASRCTADRALERAEEREGFARPIGSFEQVAMQITEAYRKMWATRATCDALLQEIDAEDPFERPDAETHAAFGGDQTRRRRVLARGRGRLGAGLRGPLAPEIHGPRARLPGGAQPPYPRGDGGDTASRIARSLGLLRKG
jgi:hypothetical protein